jgi:ribonuclease HI
MGAVEGLKAALAAPCAAFSTGIVILLDNLAAASLLADGRPAPHRGELTDTFKQLSLQWSTMQGPLPRTPVRVRWVPGHSGITGNEEADMLAKKGAVLDGSHIPPSPSFLRRDAKQKARAASHAAYIRDAPRAYQDLGILPHTRGSRVREHKLPRWVLGRLIAARTGHGDFEAYHERFHHKTSLDMCSCGKRKSPIHFFFCPRARKRWKGWKAPNASPSEMINWLLSTPSGAEEFSRFVQATSFFKDICPNWARPSV